MIIDSFVAPKMFRIYNSWYRCPYCGLLHNKLVTDSKLRHPIHAPVACWPPCVTALSTLLSSLRRPSLLLPSTCFFPPCVAVVPALLSPCVAALPVLSTLPTLLLSPRCCPPCAVHPALLLSLRYCPSCVANIAGNCDL